MIFVKNSGTCPKCGSTDIVRALSTSRTGCDGNGIRTDHIFPVMRVPRYICCSCGYSEEWIDPKHLSKIKSEFGRTPPAGKISPFE